MDAFDKLEQMIKKAQELDGKKVNIPVEKLMDHGYLKKHTHGTFESFDNFVDASGFSNIPFEDIPDEDWDKWIAAKTDMPDWETMSQDAVDEYSAEFLKDQFDL